MRISPEAAKCGDLLCKTETNRYCPVLRVDGEVVSWVPLAMTQKAAMRVAQDMARKWRNNER